MEPPRVEPPPPPPASPFDPTARPKTGGCPKPLVIGCVVLLLVGGLAALGGFYYVAKNASAVLQWSLQQMENGVMAQLPRDVTPAERERLRQAFGDVARGLREGRVKPEDFQPLQYKMLEIARKGSNVTRQDILDLTQALEATAAGRAGEGAGEAAPP